MSPHERYYDPFMERYTCISRESWISILDLSVVRHLEKGVVFLQSGSVVQQSALVVSGIVKQSYWDGQHERVADFSFDGDCIMNFDSYKKGTPSNISVEALTDTLLLVFDNEKLVAMKEADEPLMRLSINLSESIIARQQFHINLLSLASPLERYQLLLKERPEIVSQISVTEIARYLFVSREAISRARSSPSLNK